MQPISGARHGTAPIACVGVRCRAGPRGEHGARAPWAEEASLEAVPP